VQSNANIALLDLLPGLHAQRALCGLYGLSCIVQ